MTKFNRGKTTTINQQKEIVRSDINLEKWSIFTTQRRHGLRVLKRGTTLEDGTNLTQSVSIGGKGMVDTLTAEDGKIFYLLLDMWEKGGRNPSGTVHSSINRILNSLISSSDGSTPKLTRRGNWSKAWFEKKVKKLLSIPLVYEWAYRNKDGSWRTYESLTLLSSADIFERRFRSLKKQGFFDFSSFTIHPVIIKSIRERNIKPIRLDVILRLKKEISVILYRFLDLILFDKAHYERDVDDLAKELDFGASRRKDLLKQLREACAELQGNDLSTGSIHYCRVEKRVDVPGWKLTVHKSKRKTLPDPAEIPVGDGDIVTREFQESQTLYGTLTKEEQAEVNALKDDVVRYKYGGFGGEFTQKLAFIEAVKQFGDARQTVEVVSPLHSEN